MRLWQPLKRCSHMIMGPESEEAGGDTEVYLYALCRRQELSAAGHTTPQTIEHI